jgi:hypothetical protein
LADPFSNVSPSDHSLWTMHPTVEILLNTFYAGLTQLVFLQLRRLLVEKDKKKAKPTTPISAS